MPSGSASSRSRGAITAAEETAARRLFDDEIGQDDFVYSIDDPAHPSDVRSGSYTGKGGTIAAHVRLEGPAQNRIREIVLTGDFFVTPPSTILNLEAALRAVALDDLDAAVARFFAAAGVGLLTAAPEDFVQAIRNAVSGAEEVVEPVA